MSLSIFSVADEDLAPIVMPLKNRIQKHKEVPKRKVPNDYNIICTKSVYLAIEHMH